MAYVAFVSYSRLNVRYPEDASLVRRLVRDLEADLTQHPQILGNDDVCFFDTTNIETGTDWNEELSDAVARSRLAVALFSPSYFTSVWCGREFQVFLDRRRAVVGTPPPVAIIPVIWMRHNQVPDAANVFQDTDDAIPSSPFPADYRQVGLRQIMLLNSESQYTQARIALGARILKVAQDPRLPELPQVDLRNYGSAWAAPPTSVARPVSDSVTKTYFVFLSNSGWHWRPYPEQKSVGAMAQQITGDIGVQYEEIPCDAALRAKLHDTNHRRIPTVLITDPSSLTNETITSEMQDYDNRYYLNCGVIVPWDVPSPTEDQRWRTLSANICPQKTAAPPPSHDWASVLTAETLRARTVSIVEEIRLRMLNAIGGSGANFAKAENEAAAKAAQASGITVHSTPVVTNVTSTGAPT
jgi:TIR domain